MKKRLRSKRNRQPKKLNPIRLRIKRILNEEEANAELSHLKIIRMLNDDFRCSATHTSVFFSPRILKFDLIDQMSILECVRVYQKFDIENEILHERGQFTYAENTILWEIHYFDCELQNESPDPSDIHLTRRHLTIAFDGELK